MVIIDAEAFVVDRPAATTAQEIQYRAATIQATKATFSVEGGRETRVTVMRGELLLRCDGSERSVIAGETAICGAARTVTAIPGLPSRAAAGQTAMRLPDVARAKSPRSPPPLSFASTSPSAPASSQDDLLPPLSAAYVSGTAEPALLITAIRYSDVKQLMRAGNREDTHLVLSAFIEESPDCIAVLALIEEYLARYPKDPAAASLQAHRARCEAR